MLVVVQAVLTMEDSRVLFLLHLLLLEVEVLVALLIVQHKQVSQALMD
jgi:hypothetical protein